MTDFIKFFTRMQGKKKASLTDWISYGFLFLGFLIIFLPVLWLFDEFYKVSIPASEI